MERSESSSLRVVADGLLAGVVSALALTVIGTYGRRLALGNGQGGPPATAGDALADGPDTPPEMNQVTATYVQKLATGLFGESLERDQRLRFGFAWHLAYGGFWAAVYAVLRKSLRLPTMLLSTLHGLLVWAVGPGWLVPRMRLLLPPSKLDAKMNGTLVGVHLLYGYVVAAVFRRLQGKRQ
jgi:hypothetical protein